MTTLKSRIGQRLIPLAPMNRRGFNMMRHELRAWRVRSLNAINPAFRALVAHLRRRKDLQVNLGSGGKGLAGWVNTELVRTGDTVLCLDIRKPLPLADGSVVRLFCEHVVEHVDYRDDLPAMLQDWLRVLKPGGVARIIVPDVEKYLRAYAAGDPEAWNSLGWDLGRMPSDIHTPMHILNHVFHQGGEHLFGYDFETLAWALKRAGFSKIHRSAYGQSVDPDLAIDQKSHAPYSLYVDAVK